MSRNTQLVSRQGVWIVGNPKHYLWFPVKKNHGDKYTNVCKKSDFFVSSVISTMGKYNVCNESEKISRNLISKKYLDSSNVSHY